MEDETESLIDVRKRTMVQCQENQEIGRREPRGKGLRTEKKTSKIQEVCCIREEKRRPQRPKRYAVLGREEMEEGRDVGDGRGKRCRRGKREEM